MNSLRMKLVVLVLGMTVLLEGCWDTKDINKEYLPVVMGIGKGSKEKYKIVLEIPNASGKVQFLEKEAISISKAIDLIRTDAEKSINLVHLRLMLFDLSIAHEGIRDIIDYAVRANDISIKGMMAIVDGDFDKTLYHVISPTPEISTYDFFNKEAGWTPNQSLVRIWEAYRSQNSYSEDMAVPMLQNGDRTLYVFKGTAVMREDRMVGKLNREETFLYNLFKGNYTGGTIEVAKNTSVLIKKSTLKHHRRWSEKGPSLWTDMTLDVVIAESPSGKSNTEIENEVREQLNRNFERTVEKIKGYRSDVLGIGVIFRPQLSQEQIKKWKSEWFPRLEQKIDVHVNIINDIFIKDEARPETLIRS
ncbi:MULTISPECIES: Ger(x)C family spore germination protein [unclassified Paenibacillus]|uniref:Ger(x)C family spore germination protein n=1 Tax=unclassified Paenibacillus TaxID=185978 RepID=UPI0009552C39|nr:MULTISPECIES: Ger(x)C family spore germination protein [unclassified Paenibacillus]ASS65890.2 Ger(x)C family spore germination protein [Paenibacillus sp. RUD330]SIQ19932.1 germination protein, Ger(x)C family [Paenibacillus sp. RU4X]SIQ41573.1 germination protein, Ger(x)C family [Paenibacillus sp. RU4T]